MNLRIENVPYIQWHMRDDKHFCISSLDIELLRMFFGSEYIFWTFLVHLLCRATKIQVYLPHLPLFVEYQTKEAKWNEIKVKKMKRFSYVLRIFFVLLKSNGIRS